MSFIKNFRFLQFLAILAFTVSACAAPASNTAAPTAAPDTNTAQSTAPASDPSTGSGASVYVLAAGSSASYAVREQLAGHDAPNDAVGKTESISGQITINPDGSIDSANSKFVVQAGTLKTDNGMRDGYVTSRLLQTSQYPEIVFVPKEAIGLPTSLPTSGDISFQLTGDLTIRDVTKSVTWDVTGSIANGTAQGTAVVNFTFSEFNLQQPQVRSVLSIVDNIKLSVEIVLKPK